MQNLCEVKLRSGGAILDPHYHWRSNFLLGQTDKWNNGSSVTSTTAILVPCKENTFKGSSYAYHILKP